MTSTLETAQTSAESTTALPLPDGGCLFRPNHSFAPQVCGQPGSVMLGRSSLKSLHYHERSVLPDKPIHAAVKVEHFSFGFRVLTVVSGPGAET